MNARSLDLMSPFLVLDRATERTRVGGKAAHLAHLARSGFRVPDGVVLPVGVPVPDTAQLTSIVDALGPVAVRSSGISEDGDDASLAGAYTSVLGVETAEALAEAIRTCRASADEPIAVLVQRMVPAQAAGIAFSVNPVTGDPEILVSAVEGLGDRLAAGEVDGQTWVLSEGDTPEAGVLAPAQVQAVADLADAVAKVQGQPQDIEWAFAEGTL